MMRGWRIRAFLASAGLLLAAGPAWGQGAGGQGIGGQENGPALFQCSRHFANSEALYGIPRGILHAMSLVESGRAGMPWPWALNLSGRSHFPATRTEALRLMHDELGSLRADVAVGCMQIYTRWHAGSFAAGEDILDPATNVTYAAGFLRELHDRHGSWTEAVRRYHASDPQAQDTYLCRVLDWRVRLGYQRETPEMLRLCAAGAPS